MSIFSFLRRKPTIDLDIHKHIVNNLESNNDRLQKQLYIFIEALRLCADELHKYSGKPEHKDIKTFIEQVKQQNRGIK